MNRSTSSMFSDRARSRTHRLATVLAPPIQAVYRIFGRSVDITPQNLPRSGPVIVAAYHASMLDPLFVALSIWYNGRMPHFLAKDSLFREPLGTPLRALGQIPVIRYSQEASDSLKYAKEALHAGECVVIYPQGTLTKNPDLWPEKFRSGAARLSLETGAPIVPVAHWGTSLLMPPRAKKPKLDPRNIVQISYGTPIEPTVEPSKRNIALLTRHVEARVAQGVARLRGQPLPDFYTRALEFPA